MATQLHSPSPGAAILTPTHYRQLSQAIDGFRLVSATVTVTLLDDPSQARYEYECHLETTGEAPARYWCYYLPADTPEVSEIRAWDARGKLQPRVYGGDAPGSQLEVRFRDPVGQGERYTFGFSYESSIHPIMGSEGRRCTVTVADWVIFNIPCTQLLVRVELPRGAEPVTAIPACAEDEGGCVCYRYRALRPLETISFLVAYRRKLRPNAAARRTAAAVAAGGFLGSGLRGEVRRSL